MGALRYRLRWFARTHLGRILVLAVAVAVGGGLSLALVAGARRTLTAADRYSVYRGNVFDLTVQQDSGRPETAEVAKLPSVARVEMASFVFGQVSGSDGKPIESLVFAGSPDAFGDQLVAGRLPDPSKPGELVASRGAVDSGHLHLGDHLAVATLTQEQADTSGFNATDLHGPAVDGTLVGILDGPADLSSGYAVVAMPAAALDEGDMGIAASVGFIALRSGATADDLRAQLDGLPDGSHLSLAPAEWVPKEVRAGLRAQGQGIAVLAAIVAAAAVVVLGQLLARQLRLDEPERSALAAIGCSRGQRVADPLARGAMCATLGALGAIGVAYLASDVFPIGFAARVEPYPGRQIDAVAVLLGALTLVAAILLWTAGAFALDTRRRRAATAPSLADRLAGAVPSAQAGTALRFAFAGGRSRPSRSAVLGLAAVTVLVIGALTFGANLERLVQRPSMWGENFDLMIGQGEDQIAEDVQQAMIASPDVSDLALYGQTTATVGAASVGVVGLQQLKGAIEPDIVRGAGSVAEGEMEVGPLTAHELGISVGDDVTLSTDAGDHTLRVAAIALIPPVGGVDDLGHAVLVSADTLRELDPQAGMNTAGARIAKDAAPGALERVSQLVGGAGPGDRPPTILNLDRVSGVPRLVAAAVGVLGVLSLANLMVVAVHRRRRDLAVLRALGATPRWLRGVVHWQASLLTAVVLAIAVPPGIAVGRVVYRRFVEHIGTRTDIVVPLGWIAGVAIAMLLLANLVAAIPAHRTRTAAPARLLAED